MSGTTIWMRELKNQFFEFSPKPPTKWQIYTDKLLISKRFVWQWCVAFEYADIDGQTRTQRIVKRTRKEARKELKYVPETYFRINVRLERRLVQKNWEPYVDTFTYNAKGNGNGR